MREPFDPADWPGRYVKLMPDIAADGVWNRDGIGSACDGLPISDMLVDRIGAWQETYERADDDATRSDVMTVELWDGFDWVAFQREAEAIAEALRAELPGWEVFCFDTIDLRQRLLQR